MELCGRDSFQVSPGDLAEKTKLPLDVIAKKLRKAGKVKLGVFMLSFDDGKVSFNLFSDGRAIIKNVPDEKAAKSIYAEYAGF
jgi:adenylyltransferase/sulfurtransferase